MVNEYWTKCGDALWLESKGRHNSVQLCASGRDRPKTALRFLSKTKPAPKIEFRLKLKRKLPGIFGGKRKQNYIQVGSKK